MARSQAYVIDKGDTFALVDEAGNLVTEYDKPSEEVAAEEAAVPSDPTPVTE